MKHRIAVISDTHGLIRDEVREVLKTCEIIFHGGDINTQEIINELKEIATLYIVRGNNDKDWAENIPETINETVFGFSFFTQFFCVLFFLFGLFLFFFFLLAVIYKISNFHIHYAVYSRIQRRTITIFPELKPLFFSAIFSASRI